MCRREIDDRIAHRAQETDHDRSIAASERAWQPGQPIPVDDMKDCPPDLRHLHREPDLVLERFAYTEMGTFGKLTMPEFECYTVERPWFDNVPRVSCIPVGLYPLRVTRYNRGGYQTLLVANVPGRSLIKIHKGNTMRDVMGCIAPGFKLGMSGDPPIWAVLNSGDAFQEWWELMIEQIENEMNAECDWTGLIKICNTPERRGHVPEPSFIEGGV